MKSLTIVPRWAFNLEVRVEEKDIECRQLSRMDEFTSYAGESGKVYLSEFLRNDQVTLPDRTPFLRMPCPPTCRLGPEANTLADLQVKESSLVLNASGLSEGDRKSTDFEEGSKPVHGGMKHLND